jgi:hypothetical protein
MYQGFRFARPGAGQQVAGALDPKEYQFMLDYQVYAPGMHVMEAIVTYTPLANSVQNSSWDAVNDVALGVGTTVYRGSSEGISGDAIHARVGSGSIRRLSQLLTTISEANAGTPVVVFFGGCAHVSTPNVGSRFYELMHRRSIRYIVRPEDFLGVTVRYLQGEDPDSSELLPSCRRGQGRTTRRAKKRRKTARK